jgi:hypothetical protein
MTKMRVKNKLRLYFLQISPKFHNYFAIMRRSIFFPEFKFIGLCYLHHMRSAAQTVFLERKQDLRNPATHSTH